MGKINFEETGIEGLRIVHPFLLEDERGFFLKAYSKELFREAGIYTDISETFESFSVHGVVRGMHYQTNDNAQAKLVRVLEGEVFDVCIDIRKKSPTFGKWIGRVLSAENRECFYMEKGFAHGFMVTGNSALMSYTCSGAYNAGGESGILFNDPDIGIKWPYDKVNKIILSERDKKLKTFSEYTKCQ